MNRQVLFFPERSIEMSSVFFPLQSVHQDVSFELSKSTLIFSIFTLVRGPFCFRGGLSDTPREWTGQSVFLGPHAYKCQAKIFFFFFIFSNRNNLSLPRTRPESCSACSPAPPAPSPTSPPSTPPPCSWPRPPWPWPSAPSIAPP